MIEMRCLKSVVIFFSNNFMFCAVKKIINIDNHIVLKHRNATVKVSENTKK